MQRCWKIAVRAGRLMLSLAAGEVGAGGYDPLAVNGAFAPAVLDLTVQDAARNRELPIRVYLPANTTPAPVILFSHGLGGSRAGSRFLAEHWAARGYVAVILQHPGSDESVWKDEAMARRMATMNQAASLGNCLLRVRGDPAALEWLNGSGPRSVMDAEDCWQFKAD
jgi:predicted dienelactone hydrolase